jgi:hypothetical protein
MVIGLEPDADLLSRHVRFLFLLVTSFNTAAKLFYFFYCLFESGADFSAPLSLELLEDLCYTTCADGTSTFADSEAETFFHRDWLDESHSHRCVIARHNHFGA